MAAAWQVKTVGLDSLLKKLDVENTVTPEKTRILKEAADETKRSLAPTLPRRTGASASKLHAEATPLRAFVGVPRYPFVFLEAGSQYHEGAGPRAHRAKTAAQRRSGRYRITPRRFLSKERTKVRRRLIELIARMKQRVEKRWASR
jgi:hypothetical protein